MAQPLLPVTMAEEDEGDTWACEVSFRDVLFAPRILLCFLVVLSFAACVVRSLGHYIPDLPVVVVYIVVAFATSMPRSLEYAGIFP